MVTKMTSKNQITISKRILERLGLIELKDNERYFDVEVKDSAIVLKPVTITIEERIPEAQWTKFEDWATQARQGDATFHSAQKASEFLKKRVHKR